MKSLLQFINEELLDNFIWKLNKWFEYNVDQEQEYLNIILSVKQKGINIKNIEIELQNTSLYNNLKEFVNFMNDEITQSNEAKDYIYSFKQIIETTLNNKSTKNKYNNTNITKEGVN